MEHRTTVAHGSHCPDFADRQTTRSIAQACLPGTLSFVVLVTLVIFVTLDLDQPRRGLIRVNRESFDRLIESMAK